MSTRQRRVLIVLLSLALLAMSSCARQKKESDKRVVIRFATFEGPMRRVAEAFMEKNPEIIVKFEPVAGGIFDKLMVQFAGNVGPDVFFMSEQLMRSFITKGTIQDLEVFIEKDKFNLDDYCPFVRETYSYRGKIYGLSPSFSPMVLFYNKRMFDEAGVGYPNEEWTWDDFLNAAIKLIKRDRWGRTIQYGAAITSGRDGLMKLFRFGRSIFNEDGTKCIINNEEAKKAFVFLYDLIKRHRVIPTPQSVRRGVATSELFKMERAAMFFGGRWMIREFKDNKNLDFHVAPFPKDDKGVRSVPFFSAAFCISAKSKHKEAAWKFLKFLAGYEGQKIIMRYDCSVPTLKLLAESEDFLFDPNFPKPDENRIFLDSVKYATVWQYSNYIHDSRLEELIDLEFEKYLLGQQSAEEALVNIEKRVNKIIKENILKGK